MKELVLDTHTDPTLQLDMYVKLLLNSAVIYWSTDKDTLLLSTVPHITYLSHLMWDFNSHCSWWCR